MCMEKKLNAKSPDAMTDVECSVVLEDFVNSGRTGRRNAVPDILDEKAAAVSTGGLPFDMEKLNCSDDSKPDSKPPSEGEKNQGQGS
ncbi:cAMP-dependent protein kinase inhibitor beta-like isoform X3 [Mytilus galloprovincialis]|uniref:Uncharacterized protein n=3 Tax=Mytilus TaxID=6548 RepID=A0A8B6E0E6_MYTGA|nr:Hypothetical predicted protein [Mytilus galloprovincialis]